MNQPVDPRTWCRAMLLGAAPRLLGLLDRESPSPTAGSFDRGHWAWKFRDFPINIAQASMMTLAHLWRADWPNNPFRGNERLGRWIADAVACTVARQHRNGAFDTVAPNSQDLGITLQMVLSIATTMEVLGDALPSSLAGRARESLSRACRFAEAAREDYAFISNHHAWFALALLRAGRILGREDLIARSDASIAAILDNQSPDGWFAEYGGPDPGYETFGVTYLALYDRERPRPGLSAALARSVEFLSHCVHPDGSIGGNYGSRQTAQFAPGGLALLSATVPIARAILGFLVARADRGNLLTPLTSDDDNLPLLCHSYAVAGDAAVTAGLEPPPLPCESDALTRRFEDARIVVTSTPRYYAVTNLSKGGVIRIFQRQTERLAYEDCGITIDSGRRRWVSHLPSSSAAASMANAAPISVRTRFAALRLEVLTPGKFLVLRLLNLTLFRSVRLGGWIRGKIIVRLITGREDGPWELVRTVEFGPETVRIVDRVTPDGPRAVSAVSLERSLLPFHMGSAKYFQRAELVSWPRQEPADWPGELSAGRPVSISLQVLVGESGVALLPAHEKTGTSERPAT